MSKLTPERLAELRKVAETVLSLMDEQDEQIVSSYFNYSRAEGLKKELAAANVEIERLKRLRNLCVCGSKALVSGDEDQLQSRWKATARENFQVCLGPDHSEES